MKLSEVAPRRLPTSKSTMPTGQIPGVGYPHKVEILGHGRMKVTIYEDDGKTIREILEGPWESVVWYAQGGKDSDQEDMQDYDDWVQDFQDEDEEKKLPRRLPTSHTNISSNHQIEGLDLPHEIELLGNNRIKLTIFDALGNIEEVLEGLQDEIIEYLTDIGALDTELEDEEKKLPRRLPTSQSETPSWSKCPECGSTDIMARHHPGNWTAPECNYIECQDCEHQWDHQ